MGEELKLSCGDHEADDEMWEQDGLAMWELGMPRTSDFEKFLLDRGQCRCAGQSIVQIHAIDSIENESLGDDSPSKQSSFDSAVDLGKRSRRSTTHVHQLLRSELDEVKRRGISKTGYKRKRTVAELQRDLEHVQDIHRRTKQLIARVLGGEHPTDAVLEELATWDTPKSSNDSKLEFSRTTHMPFLEM